MQHDVTNHSNTKFSFTLCAQGLLINKTSSINNDRIEEQAECAR